MRTGEPKRRTRSDLRNRRRAAQEFQWFAVSVLTCIAGCGLDLLPPNGDTGPDAEFPAEFRAIDGRGNNLDHADWGSAGTPFLRLSPAQYADADGTPADQGLPNARLVSNMVATQSSETGNRQQASGFLWQWGQFVDHDIDETPPADPPEPYDIIVPRGDADFDPQATGAVTIALMRSEHETIDGVREQINAITSYIDASNVYGSDAQRAAELRTQDGTGRLKTGPDDLLPFNSANLRNAPDDSASFFLAGDVRANEQIALTAMHTLFVREHNFWADVIRADVPDASGDQIYRVARAVVAAEIQCVTYREFLPIFLGSDALPPYTGYRGDVNPGISNEFATAAYRVGHSMLPASLARLDADGNDLAIGPIALADAFFRPDAFQKSGPAPLLRGLAREPAQEVDNPMVNDVRNFLFGPPGAGGMDLAALNVQRGRDHGLASLNTFRREMGLAAYASFDELTDDAAMASTLAELYGDVDDVELWVGGLAERHMPDAMVGETFMAVLKDQFLRLRDGDRFWFESYLPPDWVALIQQQTLARIIRRNMPIGDELQPNVFLLPSENNRCDPTCDDGSAQIREFDFSSISGQLPAEPPA